MIVKQILKKNDVLYKFLKGSVKKIHLCKSKYYSYLYGREMNLLLDKTIYDEKKKMLDEKINSDGRKRTYFIIRRSYKGIGMYTHVCVYLSFIAYAVSKGYIPVIDMCNYPNIYMKDEDIGKRNAWELFFKQPVGIGLDDLGSGKIIYSSPVFLPNRTPFITSLLNDKKEFALYARVYQDFIQYNKNVKEYTDEELKIIENKKVLGVLYRGTDYTKGKPKGHPIQPTLQQVIAKAEEIMDRFGCEYIYLATDERNAEDEFEHSFPKHILTNKRKYYDMDGMDYSNHYISEVSFDRENDQFLKGLEYISSINILSKCKCFLGGGCAGTYAAVIMNNFKFEYTHIFDLGFYE